MVTETKQTLRERIVVNPHILVGKPIVRGTRIPVEIVLAHLALDIDLESLFADYPRLTPDDVRACLAYAAGLVADESVFPIAVTDTPAAD
ncbi:MAG: DUF433 domain-containing protein [Chloroflexota bacterium]|nr:DUF433 domain-containing protein [Chloroflexota bacterium]